MFLHRIERHLRRFNITATRFGREAAGDPRLVFDLRAGRIPRQPMIDRVEAYLRRADTGAAA